MKIDVIVPTLGDRLVWLDRCLASLRRQDQLDVRIMVVTPSEAPVGELLANYSADFVPSPPRGLSMAINAGLQTLRPDAEFTSWIGDDDLLAPYSLARTARALVARPEAPFAYGRVRLIDVDGNTICVQWPTRFARWTLRFGQQHVAQPGSLLRVDALRRVDMRLDDRLRNAMDLDLFIRLSRLGRPAYVPFEVAAYRLHGGSITMTKGGGDEAEGLRRASQPAAARVSRGLWRPVVALADRCFAASAWHLNRPPVPLVDGRPYTGGLR